MAEATTVSGRMDTPMAAAVLVIAALFFLFGIHKLTITLH